MVIMMKHYKLKMMPLLPKPWAPDVTVGFAVNPVNPLPRPAALHCFIHWSTAEWNAK